MHGHRHPRIDEAVKAQLDSVAHSTMLGLSHPPAIELARRLVELAPPGLAVAAAAKDKNDDKAHGGEAHAEAKVKLGLPGAPGNGNKR